MNPKYRIPLRQQINDTTISITFSDAPAGNGVEQVRKILISTYTAAQTERINPVDKSQGACHNEQAETSALYLENSDFYTDKNEAPTNLEKGRAS